MKKLKTHKRKLIYFFVLPFFQSFYSLEVFAEEQKTTFGYIEKVQVGADKIKLDAKLDTGADSSSLHAEDIERFKKAGKTWVRFSLKDRTGKTHTLELPVIKTVKIKRHFFKSQKRFVVPLTVCLDSQEIEAQVNLVDRSKFDYPMLLGRKYLSGVSSIVDPALTFTTNPHCK